MTRLIIGVSILSFVMGIILVQLIPIQLGSVFASVEDLYSSTPPILPDNMTSINYTGCDFFGNYCHVVSQPITQEERSDHFNDWCYHIINHYTHSNGKVTQTEDFRTISIDCFNFVLDQKLKPLNDKLDNLTNEIHDLKVQHK